MRDGDRLRMGEVSLDVLHVPGHRPEQINVLVTDHSRGDDPWCLLTADFLLVGDVARPDLAQSGEEGARTLFDVAIPRLRDLPDFVEVYPATWPARPEGASRVARLPLPSATSGATTPRCASTTRSASWSS